MKAFVIADWLLAHNNAVMKYNSADELSNLKIQKLLYYAQGCSLASLGKALFEEDIIAWKHGPVVEDVYQKYHRYGRGGIQEIPEYPKLDPEIELLLINTYNTFAKYSAWELANLTHKEDPWRMTPSNQTISLTLIKNYFVAHYLNVNKNSLLSENIAQLREIGTLEINWDDEEGLPFGEPFIQEVIDLVSTIEVQPDLGPTGRGSIQLEYGSRKSGKKYIGIEIYEDRRRVEIYAKDEFGNRTHEVISMEEINGRIQQF